MKKSLLLFIAFITINKMTAQVVFCPPGAEWHFNFMEALVGTIHNEKIVYTGDTMLGNIAAKKLSHTRFFISENNFGVPTITLIKQSGDTIFMRNVYTLNNWQILYNFNCPPGHGWSNVIDGGTGPAVTHVTMVDSVGQVNINGASLKRLYVSCNYTIYGNPVVFNAEITERIGSSPFLFNYKRQPISSDDDSVLHLLCYEDNTFGLKQFTSYSCNFSGKVGLNEELFESNSIAMFPNPATYAVDLKMKSSLNSVLVQVADVSGRKLEEFTLSHDSQLDLKQYKAGIYFLNIINESKIIETKRLIVVR